MQDYYGRVCGSLMYRGAGVLWEVMLAGEILSRVRAIPFVIFFIAMAFMKPYTGFYPPFSLFFTPTGGTRLNIMPLFILPFPCFSHPQGEPDFILCLFLSSPFLVFHTHRGNQTSFYASFYPPLSLFFAPTGGTRLHIMPLFILPFPVFSHPQGESSSIHKISSTIYKPNHMMYNQIYLQGRV